MTNLKARLASLELVPAKGGRFEISFDGNLVYSKLATGAFPDELEIVKLAMKKS
jgi:selT/selW/selH-like putative selenoprotein